MTIAQRLNMLLIVSILMMIVMLANNQFAKSKLSYIKTQIAIVDNMIALTYTLNKDEIAFFLNKDQEVISQHEVHYQSLLENIAQIDQQLLGDITPFTNTLTDYHTSFQQAVEQQTRIGLTNQQGFYGRLRTSVSLLEKNLWVLDQLELTAQMLTLRRYEKDFMLNHDVNDSQLFNNAYKKFITALNNNMELAPSTVEKMTQLAAAYHDDFASLVAAETTIGIKDHPGLKEKMYANALAMESALNQFHRIALEREQSLEQQTNLISLLLFGLSILIVLLVMIQTRRKILTPLNNIIRDIQEITTKTSLKQPLRYTNTDEIGHMAQTINQFIQTLDQGISEANNVVAEIAKANFNQRMEKDYHGDLAVLKEGINASADNVLFMMTQLENVMQGLNAGRFDIRMDDRVPLAFRTLVDDTLHNIHAIISDINSVMQSMNRGNFDTRVQAPAQGDLDVMKENFNDAMDRLAMAVTGITTIVTAQASGDLTKTCTADFTGQLRTLQQSINNSSITIKQTVSQSTYAANVVNEAANQVSRGAYDLSSRMQQQASALEQTSATMHQIASTVNDNTDNARSVANLAHEVQHKSAIGVSVMQQTIDAMKAIQASSHQIADIVGLIDGIAFQTNLLALNAAVEAARAGDHGRGFAVVAGEVRLLAQKSALAAQEIKTLINDSVNRIENGTELADKSGLMLTDISHAVAQVTDMISDIATASQEQSTGIEHIHKAIAEIETVTQQNASLVAQTTAAADSLKQEAHVLLENMRFFKTTQALA